ncbi:hypothetical protein C3L33_08840, partial [Rhododendron williamsianum]
MNSLSSLQGGIGLRVAELDVLISLAIACNYYEGPTCRHACPDEVPCLSAKSPGHPVIRSDSLGKSTFVPNDVTIGGSGYASVVLLTGPNMGGKSTLLRQVCWAIILDQILEIAIKKETVGLVTTEECVEKMKIFGPRREGQTSEAATRVKEKLQAQKRSKQDIKGNPQSSFSVDIEKGSEEEDEKTEGCEDDGMGLRDD